jgi:hypothetical protein
MKGRVKQKKKGGLFFLNKKNGSYIKIMDTCRNSKHFLHKNLDFIYNIYCFMRRKKNPRNKLWEREREINYGREKKIIIIIIF